MKNTILLANGYRTRKTLHRRVDRVVEINGTVRASRTKVQVVADRSLGLGQGHHSTPGGLLPVGSHNIDDKG